MPGEIQPHNLVLLVTNLADKSRIKCVQPCARTHICNYFFHTPAALQCVQNMGRRWETAMQNPPLHCAALLYLHGTGYAM